MIEGTPTTDALIAVTGMICVFVTFTVVTSIVVWQFATSQRAKVSVAREHAYQQLATAAAEAQQRAADSLERAHEELRDMRTRLTEVERMMKEVG